MWCPLAHVDRLNAQMPINPAPVVASSMAPPTKEQRDRPNPFNPKAFENATPSAQSSGSREEGEILDDPTEEETEEDVDSASERGSFAQQDDFIPL
jgi:hypothetical protein